MYKMWFCICPTMLKVCRFNMYAHTHILFLCVCRSVWCHPILSNGDPLREVRTKRSSFPLVPRMKWNCPTWAWATIYKEAKRTRKKGFKFYSIARFSYQNWRAQFIPLKHILTCVLCTQQVVCTILHLGVINKVYLAYICVTNDPYQMMPYLTINLVVIVGKLQTNIAKKH